MLIVSMQVNFTVVSLLFIASTVGFVLAGLVLNIAAVERIPYGKVMLVGKIDSFRIASC